MWTLIWIWHSWTLFAQHPPLPSPFDSVTVYNCSVLYRLSAWKTLMRVMKTTDVHKSHWLHFVTISRTTMILSCIVLFSFFFFYNSLAWTKKPEMVPTIYPIESWMYHENGSWKEYYLTKKIEQGYLFSTLLMPLQSSFCKCVSRLAISWHPSL